MIDCSHSDGGRVCPISKTPCLGECVYADILADINQGIIGLDIRKEEVFFQNKLAAEIFAPMMRPKDYYALVSLLLPDLDRYLLLSDQRGVRTLRYGGRFIEYSVNIISEMHLWIYVADITEKFRLNAIAEAVNAMNNLGYIFSGIRHELGNLVNSIKLTMTVCKNNISSYSKETILEYIERVLTEVSRIEFLLKDLRNFSMYEDFEFKNVYMPSFINDFITIVRTDFSGKNIKIRTSLSLQAEYAYIDPRALHHVMLNVFSNASDALRLTEQPEMIVSLQKEEESIVIRVRDNGCGIAEEQKKHLFQPFHTTKSHGTGLGLVIVKKMLAKMNGSIDIESREHVGTVVTISLPAGRAT